MSWRTSLTKTLHEVSFFFSSSSKNSEGVRKFLTNNYWDLKKLNPLFPILMRENETIEEPYMIAGYHYGREDIIDLKGKTEEEIETILKNTVQKAKEITPVLPCDNMKWNDVIKEQYKFTKPGHLFKILTDPNRPEELGLEILQKPDPNYPTDTEKINEDMIKYGFK